MAFVNHFSVLLVDDDPEILAVSKLAMKNFKIFGLPVKLYTATGKAAAIELINREFVLQTDFTPLAVAIIDVVMETDTSGLELCHYIREEMHNYDTGLFIRTGQPGAAPERSVLDRYDINGYIAKPEVTEDKLYTMVKSGVAYYFNNSVNISTLKAIQYILSIGPSQEGLRAFCKMFLDGALATQNGEEAAMSKGGQAAITLDGEILGMVGNPPMSEEIAQTILRRLDDEPGKPIGANGDKYIVDRENGLLLIKIAGTPANAEWRSVFNWALPPSFEKIHVSAFYTSNKTVATLWKLAQTAALV